MNKNTNAYSVLNNLLVKLSNRNTFNKATENYVFHYLYMVYNITNSVAFSKSIFHYFPNSSDYVTSHSIQNTCELSFCLKFPKWD